MARNRKPQRNERDRTHGKCGREPRRFAPMRPETNPDGVMMVNKPLGGHTFRRMFVYADTELRATRIDDAGNRVVETFEATGMEVLADLSAYETKARKRPGWAWDAKRAKRKG